MTDSTEKEKVLWAVREALVGLDEEALTPLPEFDDDLVVSDGYLAEDTLWKNFAANFAAASGRPMRLVDELTAFLEEYDYKRGFCDPVFRLSIGEKLAARGIEVDYTFERERHNDYTFGITRATGAIAESGTVILTDEDTVDRLAALAPWVHVAVLDREQRIHRTIPDAVAAFGDSPNIVWATGPSKTGDVEGILIQGVHGPGEQVCLLLG